jgi:hypothetical protein
MIRPLLKGFIEVVERAKVSLAAELWVRAPKPVGRLPECALCLVLAVGVAHAQPASDGTATGAACRDPARPMIRLELVFGTSRPGGRPVSEAEWIGFLETEVTPRFPAGLTVLGGLGQWQGSDGRLTREQSKILIILHEPDDRTEAAIEAIRAAYKRRFDQESVLRVESFSCVSF